MAAEVYVRNFPIGILEPEFDGSEGEDFEFYLWEWNWEEEIGE